MQNNKTLTNGFTLIELPVVVLIIGILAAIALPQYQKSVEKARVMAAIPIGRAVRDAQERYFLYQGAYTLNPDELDIAYSCPKYFICAFEADTKFTMTKQNGGHFGLVFSYSGRANIILKNKNYCWADRDKPKELELCQHFGSDMNVNPTRYTAEIK
jgi:prepilin-type N-terminal cleavage/methylation domain-containing protein